MRSSTVKVHMKIHEESANARVIKLIKGKKAINKPEENKF